jgi:hypothetical protein
MVTVSTELLFTDVVRVEPLKTTTDDETNLLPFAVSVKLAGNWEKVRVEGEIELRTGTGRELPQRGFNALQPGRSNRATISQPTRQPRSNEGLSMT